MHRTPFSNRDGSWRTEQKVHWRITRTLFSLSHIAYPYLQLSRGLKTWILRSFCFSECVAVILWGKSLGFRNIVSLCREAIHGFSPRLCQKRPAIDWENSGLTLRNSLPFPEKSIWSSPPDSLCLPVSGHVISLPMNGQSAAAWSPWVDPCSVPDHRLY